MKTLALACLLIFTAISNAHETIHFDEELTSFLDTDLGVSGNQYVARAYQRYAQSTQGCQSNDSRRKILVTGFGRWQGDTFNISGEVAHALISPTPAPLPQNGVWIGNATVEVDNQPFNVCSLYLSVTWDLAAAIIVNEMNRFQPERVILSGLGGSSAILEGGALNHARGYEGYSEDGTLLQNNIPWCDGRPCSGAETQPILPPNQAGVEPEIRLTWDAQRLAELARPWILQARPDTLIETPLAARPTNDYLCNNVAYVAAHAAKEVPISLAGGEIQLRPQFQTRPQVGFFHYPFQKETSSEIVHRWVQVIQRFFS